MKKIILIIPLIFSSACSSATYISECLKKDNNYINKYLIEAYNKEKTVYIDDESFTSCILSRRCHSITTSNRWTNIEIYLTKQTTSFPKESGLYSVSRDYTFKNCLKTYGDFGKNEFTDEKNNNFCVSGKMIDKPTAKVIFKARENRYESSKNKTITIRIRIEIDINDKKFLEKNSVVSYNKMGQSICEKDDLTEKIITNDF